MLRISVFFALKRKPWINSCPLLLVKSSLVSSREKRTDVAAPYVIKWFHMNVRCKIQPTCDTLFINGSLPLEPAGKGSAIISRGEKKKINPLHHSGIIELGPLKDVLLTHNVRVDEKVAIAHTEMLLAGSTLEALQMVNFVPHAHRHLKRPDPLFTGCTEAVLTKEPEIIPPT